MRIKNYGVALYRFLKNRKEYSTLQPHRLNKEFELILNLNLNSIEFYMSSEFNSRGYGSKQVNKQINEMIKMSNSRPGVICFGLFLTDSLKHIALRLLKMNFTWILDVSKVDNKSEGTGLWHDHLPPWWNVSNFSRV